MLKIKSYGLSFTALFNTKGYHLYYGVYEHPVFTQNLYHFTAPIASVYRSLIEKYHLVDKLPKISKSLLTKFMGAELAYVDVHEAEEATTLAVLAYVGEVCRRLFFEPKESNSDAFIGEDISKFHLPPVDSSKESLYQLNKYIDSVDANVIVKTFGIPVEFSFIDESHTAFVNYEGGGGEQYNSADAVRDSEMFINTIILSINDAYEVGLGVAENNGSLFFSNGMEIISMNKGKNDPVLEFDYYEAFLCGQLLMLDSGDHITELQSSLSYRQSFSVEEAIESLLLKQAGDFSDDLILVAASAENYVDPLVFEFSNSELLNEVENSKQIESYLVQQINLVEDYEAQLVNTTLDAVIDIDVENVMRLLEVIYGSEIIGIIKEGVSLIEAKQENAVVTLDNYIFDGFSLSELVESVKEIPDGVLDEVVLGYYPLKCEFMDADFNDLVNASKHRGVVDLQIVESFRGEYNRIYDFNVLEAVKPSDEITVETFLLHGRACVTESVIDTVLYSGFDYDAESIANASFIDKSGINSELIVDLMLGRGYEVEKVGFSDKSELKSTKASFNKDFEIDPVLSLTGEYGLGLNCEIEQQEFAVGDYSQDYDFMFLYDITFAGYTSKGYETEIVQGIVNTYDYGLEDFLSDEAFIDFDSVFNTLPSLDSSVNAEVVFSGAVLEGVNGIFEDCADTFIDVSNKGVEGAVLDISLFSRSLTTYGYGCEIDIDQDIISDYIGAMEESILFKEFVGIYGLNLDVDSVAGGDLPVAESIMDAVVPYGGSVDVVSMLNSALVNESQAMYGDDFTVELSQGNYGAFSKVLNAVRLEKSQGVINKNFDVLEFYVFKSDHDIVFNLCVVDTIEGDFNFNLGLAGLVSTEQSVSSVLLHDISMDAGIKFSGDSIGEAFVFLGNFVDSDLRVEAVIAQLDWGLYKDIQDALVTGLVKYGNYEYIMGACLSEGIKGDYIGDVLEGSVVQDIAGIYDSDVLEGSIIQDTVCNYDQIQDGLLINGRGVDLKLDSDVLLVEDLDARVNYYMDTVLFGGRLSGAEIKQEASVVCNFESFFTEAIEVIKEQPVESSFSKMEYAVFNEGNVSYLNKVFEVEVVDGNVGIAEAQNEVVLVKSYPTVVADTENILFVKDVKGFISDYKDSVLYDLNCNLSDVSYDVYYVRDFKCNYEDIRDVVVSEGYASDMESVTLYMAVISDNPANYQRIQDVLTDDIVKAGFMDTDKVVVVSWDTTGVFSTDAETSVFRGSSAKISKSLEAEVLWGNVVDYDSSYEAILAGSSDAGFSGKQEVALDILSLGDADSGDAAVIDYGFSGASINDYESEVSLGLNGVNDIDYDVELFVDIEVGIGNSYDAIFDADISGESSSSREVALDGGGEGNRGNNYEVVTVSLIESNNDNAYDTILGSEVESTRDSGYEIILDGEVKGAGSSVYDAVMGGRHKAISGNTLDSVLILGNETDSGSIFDLVLVSGNEADNNIGYGVLSEEGDQADNTVRYDALLVEDTKAAGWNDYVSDLALGYKGIGDIGYDALLEGESKGGYDFWCDVLQAKESKADSGNTFDSVLVSGNKAVNDTQYAVLQAEESMADSGNTFNSVLALGNGGGSITDYGVLIEERSEGVNGNRCDVAMAGEHKADSGNVFDSTIAFDKKVSSGNIFDSVFALGDVGDNNIKYDALLEEGNETGNDTEYAVLLVEDIKGINEIGYGILQAEESIADSGNTFDSILVLSNNGNGDVGYDSLLEEDNKAGNDIRYDVLLEKGNKVYSAIGYELFQIKENTADSGNTFDSVLILGNDGASNIGYDALLEKDSKAESDIGYVILQTKDTKVISGNIYDLDLALGDKADSDIGYVALLEGENKGDSGSSYDTLLEKVGRADIDSGHGLVLIEDVTGDSGLLNDVLIDIGFQGSIGAGYDSMVAEGSRISVGGGQEIVLMFGNKGSLDSGYQVVVDDPGKVDSGQGYDADLYDKSVKTDTDISTDAVVAEDLEMYRVKKKLKINRFKEFGRVKIKTVVDKLSTYKRPPIKTKVYRTVESERRKTLKTVIDKLIGGTLPIIPEGAKKKIWLIMGRISMWLPWNWKKTR